MKEYVGMVAAQIAQVLLIIVSKYAIADGMSNYSFIFYSNALASLILLPLSLIFHRSGNRPPLTIIVICGFFIIGVLGFFAQVFGYSGITLSSATLATTLLNLTPGFTFLLAILFRMEAFDLSLTTQAKFIGTVVSIAGAIIITLYKGPSILSSSLKSEISQHLLVKPSDWVLGGIFIAITSILSSMCFIGQATVLKKYPAEVIVMFSYCIVYTILSALASFIVGDDLNSYSLRPKKRLLFVLYSGIFGSAFQFTVQACLLGSVVVVIGFYSVMWGKAKEKIVVFHNEEAPLLQNVEENITSPSP
uniref:WAT1-related protein n=1 Tax=Lactuca sativa TaxID=4236 RepID=A0A9R1W4I8_LACSA|nr:hypothetical protein LSAT_V11C300121000 [Lactuca sativa]